MREADDHGAFQPQPAVAHAARQLARLPVQRVHAVEQRVEGRAQAGGRSRTAQIVHARAGSRQQVGGQIAAVEGKKILRAVLQVVEHLQRRAQRVRGRMRAKHPRRADRARAGRPASPRTGNSRAARPSSRSGAWSRPGGRRRSRSRAWRSVVPVCGEARAQPRRTRRAGIGGTRPAPPPSRRVARFFLPPAGWRCRRCRRRCGRRRRRRGSAGAASGGSAASRRGSSRRRGPCPTTLPRSPPRVAGAHASAPP